MENEAALLEKQHVHNVYEKTAAYLSDLQGRAWPRVRQFLLQQEPGSLVADIGCGTGKYLNANREVWTVGCDLCSPLVAKARKQGNEVLVCDNLQLPFRDRIFRAVISIGVIHHFSTPERRICAIKEMARTIVSGGEIMIYVWAQEQKRRCFHKQDVLVPWNMALCSRSSSESGSAVLGHAVVPEECGKMTVDLGANASGRRTHSVGNYMALGECCIKIQSPHGRASHACLGRSWRSWFFSKSLDESSMKRYIERIKPMSGPPRLVESAVLVQPVRHRSIDLGMGGELLSEPSPEEDDVFVEAVSQEEQWLKLAGALKEMNGSAQRRVLRDHDNAEDRQIFPTVRNTNDLNCIKKRAVPLDYTHSIRETMALDGQDDDLADSKDLMRYYHVFREGELTRLIEENVPELSIQSTCFDHGNWCVIAKKNLCS